MLEPTLEGSLMVLVKGKLVSDGPIGCLGVPGVDFVRANMTSVTNGPRGDTKIVHYLGGGVGCR